ncbi:MAG: F0F1 ATP synthase subunit A [Marinobacter sp.]|nr:F0F1 ATP synthase subunit A [Marinobacter sp.]
MQFSPDNTIVLTLGGWGLNATIVNTWIVMVLLVGISWFVTRNLRADVPPDRLRTALEVIVKLIQGQIEEVTQNSARHVMYFAGTLFLFIALSNLMLVIPGFSPPTSSLSTTMALALSVLVAVPVFSIASGGVKSYLRTSDWKMKPAPCWFHLSEGNGLTYLPVALSSASAWVFNLDKQWCRSDRECTESRPWSHWPPSRYCV